VCIYSLYVLGAVAQWWAMFRSAWGSCLHWAVVTSRWRHPAAVSLQLLGHLQEGVDGSVLVALLGVDDSADHLWVHVREHILQGL